MCGDFNFNKINWLTHEVSAQGQSTAARKFMDSVNDCFLYQHVVEPTHNVDGENPTRLDLIFFRNSEDIEILEILGNSHHMSHKYLK